MATNRWQIILDNFPKYFSERVQFLYGFSVAFHAISHMRAVWDNTYRVDTEFAGHIKSHGDMESQHWYESEASATSTLYADTTSAYKVEVEAIPRTGVSGKLDHAMRFDVDMRVRNNIYARIELQHKYDVEAAGHVLYRGGLDVQYRVDMEAVPHLNMIGRVDSEYAVDLESEGYIEMTGMMNSTHAYRTTVVAIVAMFYKLFERNDETLEAVNDLTLEDFCIKEIV